MLTVPARLERSRLPERAAFTGASVHQAQLELDAAPRPPSTIDLTHADTRRFPPPQYALDLFREAVLGGTEPYTPFAGDPGVIDDLAERLSRLLGVPVDPQRELLITAGTQAGLFCSLAALVEDDMQVCLPDPDYMESERILRFFGASVLHLPLSRDGEDIAPDLAELERRAQQGARVLVFSHPNNPTGAVYSRHAIATIAAIACNYDMTIVVDELYFRLVYDGRTYHHLAAEPGMADRCVTLLGPSKTEQLTGYRLGCLIGPGRIIARATEVHARAVVRAPAYAQHVLRGWLGADDAFVAQRVADYQRVRDLAFECLSTMDFVEVRRPAATTYMFPVIDRLGGDDLALAKLLITEAGVVVTPGHQFGPRGSGSLRICFAQDEGRLVEALDRLAWTLGHAG